MKKMFFIFSKSNGTYNPRSTYFIFAFDNSILVWIPPIYFALILPFWLLNTLKRKSFKLELTIIFYFKMAAMMSIIFMEVLNLIRVSQDTCIYSYLNSVTRLATYGVIVSLLVVAKKKRLITNIFVFLYWLLELFFMSFKAKSIIFSVLKHQVDFHIEFVQFFAFFMLIIINLILCGFAEISSSQKNLSPEKSASAWSKLSFYWINELIYLGYTKPLTRDDMWNLDEEQASEYLTQTFEKEWNKHVKDYFERLKTKRIETDDPDVNIIAKEPKKPSISLLMWKIFMRKILFSAFLKFIHDLLQFAGPVLLSLLLNFLMQPKEIKEETPAKGIFLAILLFITSSVRSFLLQHYFHIMYTSGAEVRTALINVIYKKSLRLSSNSRRECSIGEITNLVSVNAQAILDLFPYLNIIWSGPFQIIVATIMLWRFLGFATLIGLFIMIIFIPINTYRTSLRQREQTQLLREQDQRVKLMNEILVGIRIIKYMGWETCFQGIVDKIRHVEIKYLRKIGFITSLSGFLWVCTPFLVSAGSFGAFSFMNSNGTLDPMVVFVSVCLFDIIKFPLNVLPFVITTLQQSYIGLVRINRFLLREELNPMMVTYGDQKDEIAIRVKNGSLGWSTSEYTLNQINFEVPKGSLVAVIGKVGSGKTSLISALLGEMYNLNSSSSSQIYLNSRSIAYAPQQAWIKNATLKENILFEQEYNENLYEAVVDACALRSDIELMPAGDETEIGEKGINLSGGQKQRISLARALYSRANIYLFDDPLSAVDSHVGKHIFDRAIGRESWIKEKTRLVVTNSLAFLPYFDRIIMFEAGRIHDIGTYEELMNRSSLFVEFVTTNTTGNYHSSTEDEAEKRPVLEKKMSMGLKKDFSEVELCQLELQKVKVRKKKSFGSMSKINQLDSKLPNRNGKLIQSEKIESGNIKASLIGDYLKACRRDLSSIFFGMMLTSSLFGILINLWLSEWSNDAWLENTESGKIFYIGIYLLLGLSQCFFNMFSRLCHLFMTIRAAKNLHDEMLKTVLRAKIEFFESTPIGRIMNRFSRDVESLETSIPTTFSELISNFLNLFTIVVTISLSTPVFLVTLIPILLVYIVIQRYYMASTRQLKRLESSTKSPIFSHLSESLAGVSTIRAYNMESKFLRMMQHHLDENLIYFYPNRSSNRWLAVRLEMIGNLITLLAALFASVHAAINSTINAGLAGVSLSFSIGISAVLNNFVRVSSEFEANITSIEAIKEYCELEQEPPLYSSEPSKIPLNWPKHGRIRFVDYSVRYRPDLCPVLSNLNIEINSGEKIGIVGRTGAGKSTLTLALFRIIEYHEGEIWIDEVEIHAIGLHELRQRLTMIPQDPILFSSSLRMNLDPMGQYSESELWSALEMVHFKSFFEQTPQKLDFELTEGGQNLSVGQRQLICLARALLRRSRIIVFDEATASIDQNTDDLIQKTIRDQFKQCTVLTIAHRLNTVMDSSRIMVIDHGRVVEFDTPKELLDDPSSIFYSMASSANII